MTPAFVREGLARLRARIDATGAAITEGFPHYGDPATGRWTTSPAGDWTVGFWNGLCWLAAHAIGEARYLWGTDYLYEALSVLAGTLEPARI